MLSSDRSIGMGPSAIPWSSIERYATRYGLPNDEFERLARLIRSMDAAFLGHKKE
jgi:hypothetical protein